MTNKHKENTGTGDLQEADKLALDAAINAARFPNFRLMQKTLEEIAARPASTGTKEIIRRAKEYANELLADRTDSKLPFHTFAISHLSAEELKAIKTPDELFTKLLNQNSGIAFGDVHMSKEEHSFLADKIPFFKEHGVTQVAMEIPFTAQGTFDQIDALPTKEEKLKKFDELLAKDLEDVKKDNKITPGFKQQDSAGIFGIARAAIANGLQIICMDSNRDSIKNIWNGTDMGPEAMKLRFAQSNFDWPLAIAAFKHKHNDLCGKVIMIGGEGHYDNRINGHADEMAQCPSVKFLSSKSKHDENKISDAHANGYDYAITINDASGQIAYANRVLEESVKILSPTLLPNQKHSPIQEVGH